MRVFNPKIVSCLKEYNSKKLINDILAGIIVAIIALPLSIALAIASGVSPEKGLYTAIVAGLVIGTFGGSKVNISGPTAAFATIVAGIVLDYSIEGLIIATILAGLILIIMGLCRFGSLIKFIPTCITVGFTSGIAVTILVGQIKDFLGLTFLEGTKAIETIDKIKAIISSISTFNYKALIVGVIGMVILIGMPILTKTKYKKFSMIISKIPPSIIAVLVGILVVKFSPLNANTIGTLYPNIPKGLPKFSLPSFDFSIVIKLLPSAFTIALLASIESLLSCVVSDGMINDKHNSNTELIAQGLGNICSGLFGGIPATGAIARTAANVKNGGRSPISSIVHAIVLILCLLVLMPVAKLIPMPIIAGVLFMVAYNMSEWRHFVQIIKTKNVIEIIVLVLTFVLTIIFNLIVAIGVGLVVFYGYLFYNKYRNKNKDKQKVENNMSKKVLVISSSLRENGNSYTLAESFANGAKERGHSVEFISLKDKKLEFCKGCFACQKIGKCVIDDDANEIMYKMLESDVICFASPMYYYQMTGQLKTLMDRANALYSLDYKFRDIYLLGVAHDTDKNAFNEYVGGVNGWISCFEKAKLKGTCFVGGVENVGDINCNEKLEEAYNLGKNV